MQILLKSIVTSLFILFSISIFAEEDESSAIKVKRWRAGFASTTNFVGSDSISVQRIYEKHYWQFFGAVPNWEKDFTGIVGISYQRVVSGTINKGLHTGPLTGGGVNGKNAQLFAGWAVGAHYEFSDFVTVSLDGGPTVTSYKGGDVVNFQIRPFGTLLGLGFHFSID
jgi:hypothetical protein